MRLFLFNREKLTESKINIPKYFTKINKFYQMHQILDFTNCNEDL
jgi:hypothetical protein